MDSVILDIKFTVVYTKEQTIDLHFLSGGSNGGYCQIAVLREISSQIFHREALLSI
jgi:hypothetical protein